MEELEHQLISCFEFSVLEKSQIAVLFLHWEKVHCKNMTLNAKFSVLHKNVWLSGGFPGGASDKEPTCQCQRYRMPGFSPWVRKIPWRRKWQSTPVPLPGKSHGPKSLVGCTPKSRTPPSDFTFTLVTKAKIWKQPKRPSIDEWVRKLWYIHTHNGTVFARERRGSCHLQHYRWTLRAIC